MGDSGATVNPARPAGEPEASAALPVGEDSAAPGGEHSTGPGGEADRALPQMPFGAWPSPITAAQVAGGRVRVAYPAIIGDTTWWQEDKPEEGGRTTVVRCGLDGTLTTLLPAPWTARNGR